MAEINTIDDFSKAIIDWFTNCHVEPIENSLLVTLRENSVNQPFTTYGTISKWNIGPNVVTMVSAFDVNNKSYPAIVIKLIPYFNMNIGAWNTTYVKSFTTMFRGAISFNNGGQPLEWNTIGATTMSSMFYGAAKFNQSLGNNFNTTNVTSMSSMFYGAANFNQSLGNNFNTVNVTSMSSMFNGAANFNQSLGTKFNTNKVKNMTYMFYGATNFNQSLGNNFNTANVTSMYSMFNGAANFDQSLGNNFNTGNVTNMSYMFAGTTIFNQSIGTQFNTAKVRDMSNMFDGAALFDKTLGAQFNTTLVTTMAAMFKGATKFNQSLGIHFNTSSVKFMDEMFSGAVQFNKTLGNNFNTSKVKNMEKMFKGATNFNQSLGINFGTFLVESMSEMFYEAREFNQPFGDWFILNNISNMSYMFYNAVKFNQPFTTKGVSINLFPQSPKQAFVINLKNMFYGAERFLGVGIKDCNMQYEYETDSMFIGSGVPLSVNNDEIWNTWNATKLDTELQSAGLNRPATVVVRPTPVPRIKPSRFNNSNIFNADLFLPRYYRQTSVEYKGYIYIIGGLEIGPYSFQKSSELNYAQLNKNGTVGNWTLGSDLYIPGGIEFATSVAYNDYIYVIGGIGITEYLSSVYYARVNEDGSVGVWKNGLDLPTTIAFSTSVVYNGYIYVFGGDQGFDFLSSVYYSRINKDGSVGTWQRGQDLPRRIAAATSVAHNGYVFIMGGFDIITNKLLASFYYAKLNGDGSVGTWKTGADLPVGIGRAKSLVYNDYVYIIGGFTDFYEEHMTSVYRAKINTDGVANNWKSSLDLQVFTPVDGGEEGVETSTIFVYNGYVYFSWMSPDGTIFITSEYYAPLNEYLDGKENSTPMIINLGFQSITLTPQ